MNSQIVQLGNGISGFCLQFTHLIIYDVKQKNIGIEKSFERVLLRNFQKIFKTFNQELLKI